MVHLHQSAWPVLLWPEGPTERTMAVLDDRQETSVQVIDHHRLTGGRSDEVSARLGQRPAAWLRPFLQLAAQPWHSGSAGHWFRIGPFDRRLSAPFVWHPHGTEELFTSFAGSLAVEESSEGAVLVLSGRANGGRPEVNTQAIGSLLDLLASAVNATDDAHASG